MKFNVKSFVTGVILGTLGISTVFASPISKSITAVYSINKVIVDGNTLQLAEDNQPFVVDGRTYLPVRAISEALGKDVVYDNKASNIIINSKSVENNSKIITTEEPAAHLSTDIVSGYENLYPFKRSMSEYMFPWDTSDDMDNAGQKHTSGVIFEIYVKDRNTIPYVDIALLGKYKRFQGQMVLSEVSKNFEGVYSINILADGILVKTIDNVKSGTLPQNLDLDVTGVQKLTFNFKTDTNVVYDKVRFGIVDVKLYQ